MTLGVRLKLMTLVEGETNSRRFPITQSLNSTNVVIIAILDFHGKHCLTEIGPAVLHPVALQQGTNVNQQQR